MESKYIGREAKVYGSLWSGGNESRSRDHLHDFYLLIYTLFIYMTVSRSKNRMKFVLALTRTVLFQQYISAQQ